MKKPQLLIFDINETLLDLGKLKSAIQAAFNTKYAFTIWFSTLLQYSMVESICERYHGFGEIGKATLRMTAEKLNTKITDDAINEILALITQLPAHQDVKEGLKKLQDDGFQLVAFTNGTPSALKSQLKYAGLTSYFDRLFSVEEIRSFKPQAKTYQYVLDQMNIEAKHSMMVAAHPWDLAGAKNVGIQTSFIARTGQSYYPLMDQPDFYVKDLKELAKSLAKIDD